MSLHEFAKDLAHLEYVLPLLERGNPLYRYRTGGNASQHWRRSRPSCPTVPNAWPGCSSSSTSSSAQEQSWYGETAALLGNRPMPRIVAASSPSRASRYGAAEAGSTAEERSDVVSPPLKRNIPDERRERRSATLHANVRHRTDLDREWGHKSFCSIEFVRSALAASPGRCG